LLGNGIFAQESPDWKQSHDLLRPQLQHRNYKDLGIGCLIVDDLVQLVGRCSGAVDVQPLFARLTLDITTVFPSGALARGLSEANGSAVCVFATAFNTAQQWVVKRLMLHALYWLVGSGEFRQACRGVHAFVDPLKVGSHVQFSRQHLILTSLHSPVALPVRSYEHPGNPEGSRVSYRRWAAWNGHCPHPRGSPVAFRLYSMHGTPVLHGMDAELLRPERWEEDRP